MRENIIIDDKAAVSDSETTTKEGAEVVLYEFAGLHYHKDLSDLKGKIKFADNYNYKSLRQRK